MTTREIITVLASLGPAAGWLFEHWSAAQAKAAAATSCQQSYTALLEVVAKALE